MKTLSFSLWIILCIALVEGCGKNLSLPTNDTGTKGDPVAGKALFYHTQELAGAPTCSTCHVTQPGDPAIVGPNLSGIATRAAQRVPGQSAEEYIRTSILDPYAYVLGGYQSSIMVRNYRQLLTPKQIDDLVAYLMTLK